MLVGLNSLLDRCNSVFLPNGEVIKRHPDTTIVVTTNNDYAGCKQMNQSVISRMNLVIDLEEPDEETLVQREAAHYTILSSVSADAESRSEVENGCLDSILAA